MSVWQHVQLSKKRNPNRQPTNQPNKQITTTTRYSSLLYTAFLYSPALSVCSTVKTVLDNYCGSDNPCPDGPEFNVSACFNTGFMTGVCPHKCNSYPCQNKAVCELNKDYKPICKYVVGSRPLRRKHGSSSSGSCCRSFSC